MKFGKFFIVALLILSLFPQSVPADKGIKFPWELLPKAKGLNESQKKTLIEEVFKKEFSYGKCPDTIYKCLLESSNDNIAIRLANFSAFLLSKGAPPKAISLVIKERGKLANPVKTFQFNLTDSPIYGNKEAKITLVEFAEFKCPYCQEIAPELKKLIDDSGGLVRQVFKHFPLKSHSGTVLSSRAAQSAHRQGKFWEMYELLYRDREKQELEQIMSYAMELGLDLDKFKKDMEDEALVKLIERDKIEGIKAGVDGTPTFFINGKHYNLRSDEAFLKDIINEEAEGMGLPPPFKEW
ncbi:MAG: hypothetical protein Kow0090_00860 [Myxococcota bacterium]